MNHQFPDRAPYDRHPSVNRKLPGRYMLADGREYPCTTLEISLAALTIKGSVAGVVGVGEYVIAYFEELGRITGEVLSECEGAFVLDIHTSASKQHRLKAKIDWLIRQETGAAANRRRSDRVETSDDRTAMQMSDGREVKVELVDVSKHGAAILSDTALSVGAKVTLGDRSATVVRCFVGGAALSFEDGNATPSGDGLAKT